MAVSEKENANVVRNPSRWSVGGPRSNLSDYVHAIPGVASFEDSARRITCARAWRSRLQAGPQVGDGRHPTPLDGDTLRFGIAHDWKQIIFGHIGRNPEGSLAKVAKRLVKSSNAMFR